MHGIMCFELVALTVASRHLELTFLDPFVLVSKSFNFASTCACTCLAISAESVMGATSAMGALALLVLLVLQPMSEASTRAATAKFVVSTDDGVAVMHSVTECMPNCRAPPAPSSAQLPPATPTRHFTP